MTLAEYRERARRLYPSISQFVEYGRLPLPAAMQARERAEAQVYANARERKRAERARAAEAKAQAKMQLIVGCIAGLFANRDLDPFARTVGIPFIQEKVTGMREAQEAGITDSDIRRTLDRLCDTTGRKTLQVPKFAKLIRPKLWLDITGE